MKKMKKQKGFTLLELVVVVAVLGLIASLATEMVVQETNQQRYDSTKERRQVIREGLHRYYNSQADFPITLDELVDSSSPYILNVDFESGTPVYRDGWGNNVSNPNDFGWTYTKVVSGAETLVYLESVGMDGVVGISSSSDSAEATYEADYPSTTYPLTTSDIASGAVAAGLY